MIFNSVYELSDYSRSFAVTYGFYCRPTLLLGRQFDVETCLCVCHIDALRQNGLTYTQPLLSPGSPIILVFSEETQL